jgi:hypothetical protein
MRTKENQMPRLKMSAILIEENIKRQIYDVMELCNFQSVGSCKMGVRTQGLIFGLECILKSMKDYEKHNPYILEDYMYAIKRFVEKTEELKQNLKIYDFNPKRHSSIRKRSKLRLYLPPHHPVSTIYHEIRMEGYICMVLKIKMWKVYALSILRLCFNRLTPSISPIHKRRSYSLGSYLETEIPT